jgi:ABC-type multidrug transport system ATPase subunit
MFTCAAFFISSLTHNEQTASNIGLLFFLLFYLFGQIATFLFYGPFSAIGTNSYYFDLYRYLFMLVPGFAAPFGFYQGMNQMVSATSNGGGGLKMSEINLNIMPELTLSDGNVETTFWSLNLTWGLMFVNSFTCLALAVYFDNALPNSYGRKKGWCFCLNPNFWCPKEKSAEAQRQDEQSAQKEDRSDLSKHIVPGMSGAVKAEAERIIKQDWGEEGVAPPVQVKGMDIFFPAYSFCERIQFIFSMCGCAKKPSAKNEVRAVQGITYGIDKDSLFVLLGHNGAGKTTTINALVGNLRTSGGTASVFGNDIGEDMGSINQIMGVCPQHDILWDQLTGAEHLELFSVLRGIPEEAVVAEVASRLRDVNLVKAGFTTSGAYSGGMKRRLSIALSLLGNPKIVYLDEPTTGMDPVTRRSVWDMIVRAKRGRVIVLTTHSMEEADVLGDRVAIMSHGKIQALGSSLALKKEYGGGYKMTLISKSPEFYDSILQFMGDALEGCTLQANIDGAMFFRVPEVADDELIDFFLEVEDCKDELGISDLSIGLTTLEEVFLTLSKMDESEDFSYGDTGKASLAGGPSKTRRPRFEFTLPDNTEPGTVVSVPHVQFPNDAAMNIDFKVPLRKKGGDVVRVKYTAHPELAFAVPAEATEGTRLSLPHPQADQGAEAITYTVPDGVIPGDTVKIPYKQVVAAKLMGKMQFVIPEGVIAGATLSIPVPVEGVAPVMYTVPEKKVAGDSVELQYEIPSTSAENKASSDSGEASSTSINVSAPDNTNNVEAKKPALPTFWGYLSALTIKTIQFQKTRVAQTCCIVCMPVVLMLLLLLLGLLFDSVKLQIVCGEGVNKEDCIEKGFNMTCVKNIFENSGRPTTPGIVVGEASWGSINPNCGTDKGVDDGSSAFICYDGLEKVKFNDVPFAATPAQSSGLGKISNKRDPLLVDWYQGFRYTMTRYVHSVVTSRPASVTTPFWWNHNFGGSFIVVVLVVVYIVIVIVVDRSSFPFFFSSPPTIYTHQH